MSMTPWLLTNPNEASLQVHSQLLGSLPNAVHSVRTNEVSNKKHPTLDGGKWKKKLKIADASWSGAG